MRVLVLLCAICLAGCALRATQASVPPGTSTMGGAFEARSHSSTLAAVLITLGLIVYSSGTEAGSAVAPATELDPRRSVSEQDCTRPLADTGGNLRCK